MSWSGAPHSVYDMILHTFGKDRVTPYPIHYYPSDDEKYLSSSLCVFYPVIAELGFMFSSSPSSIAHSRHASPEPEPTWSSHSATTTILLDDLHAKATLQPYNHLCVREYTRAQECGPRRTRSRARAPTSPARSTTHPRNTWRGGASSGERTQAQVRQRAATATRGGGRRARRDPSRRYRHFASACHTPAEQHRLLAAGRCTPPTLTQVGTGCRAVRRSRADARRGSRGDARTRGDGRA
jgi:hypothetical protein